MSFRAEEKVRMRQRARSACLATLPSHFDDQTRDVGGAQGDVELRSGDSATGGAIAAGADDAKDSDAEIEYSEAASAPRARAGTDEVTVVGTFVARARAQTKENIMREAFSPRFKGKRSVPFRWQLLKTPRFFGFCLGLVLLAALSLTTMDEGNPKIQRFVGRARTARTLSRRACTLAHA